MAYYYYYCFSLGGSIDFLQNSFITSTTDLVLPDAWIVLPLRTLSSIASNFLEPSKDR